MVGNYIVVDSFIGGGNRSTCCKSLKKLYHIMLYQEHLNNISVILCRSVLLVEETAVTA
jgi:hypothetical protein